MNWLDVNDDFFKTIAYETRWLLGVIFMTCIKCAHDIQCIDALFCRLQPFALMPFCRHALLYIMCLIGTNRTICLFFYLE